MSVNDNHKRYELNVQNQGVLAKQDQAKFQSTTEIVRRSRNATFLFSFSVFTFCGIWAYLEWKKKRDNPPVEVEKEDSMERLKGYFTAKAERPSKLKLSAKDMGFIDPRSEGYEDSRISRNPNVVFNKEKNTVETQSHTWIFTCISSVPADKVHKDENGNFKFDEEGLPLIKRNKLQQFVHDDIQRAYNAFNYIKKKFS